MRYVGIHALLVGVLQKEIYKKVIQNNDHLSVYHFLIPPDLSANHRVNASIVTDKDNLSDSISLLLLWGILQTLTIGSIYFFLKAEFTLYLPWRKSGCKIVLITFLNELKTSQAWRPVLPDSKQEISHLRFGHIPRLQVRLRPSKQWISHTFPVPNNIICSYSFSISCCFTRK